MNRCAAPASLVEYPGQLSGHVFSTLYVEHETDEVFDLANLLMRAPQHFCRVLENDVVLTSGGWQSPTDRRRL